VSGDPCIECSCDPVGWRGGPRARRESAWVCCSCPRLGSGEVRSCPLSGQSFVQCSPIRPLQLCADGVYQPSLGVLGVPLIMVPDTTISSYGGNTTVMAKSFVMAVRSVAQTWYSSLRPGTITSWQKLKDMLVTSFQGFQTKPVTAQALFQCTQDHEEYLQAYVRRFLRLRAQAPTVLNKIIIEAMIKGLHLGPMAQYFFRKPPQTLEKLLQKMDEYIRANNDFRQRRMEAYMYSEMTRGFGGRLHPRHVRTIHIPSQSEDKSNCNQGQQRNSQSTGVQQNSFRPITPRGREGRRFRGRYNSQPRRLFYLFCGEDKRHTTRTFQVTIQK
jgi:hypothetical protein